MSGVFGAQFKNKCELGKHVTMRVALCHVSLKEYFMTLGLLRFVRSLWRVGFVWRAFLINNTDDFTRAPSYFPIMT